MHAQQLGPAAAAGHPPLPMLPHPGLGPGLPPSSAASLLGLTGLGGAPHPLAILNAKHDLHRGEDKQPALEDRHSSKVRFPLLNPLPASISFVARTYT